MERYRRRGRVPAESNRSQADVPRGAVVLPNRWGSAPGLWLEGDPGLVIMLPGVPQEMRNLLSAEVAPRLAARAGGAAVIRSRTVRITGIPESTLAERLGEIEAAIAPLTLACPGLDQVIRSHRVGPSRHRRRHQSRAGRDRAPDPRRRRGLRRRGRDLAALVLDRARERGIRIAVAESCTGGLLGGRLTEIPGSSAVFAGGVIVYEDAAKTSLLGVSPELLAADGAVSEPWRSPWQARRSSVWAPTSPSASPASPAQPAAASPSR